MADAMVIVVTGGNSFLARHLIPYLANKNTTVFATYRTPDERLEVLRRVPGVHLVQLNVGEDGEGYRQLPQEADALVHVAAASTARPGGIDDFITCNVVGARNVARYASAARIKKVIYTSSISVYGDIHEPCLRETYPITNPDDYGLTKYLAERVFAETEGLSCVALPLPGILGKGRTARGYRHCYTGYWRGMVRRQFTARLRFSITRPTSARFRGFRSPSRRSARNY